MTNIDIAGPTASAGTSGVRAVAGAGSVGERLEAARSAYLASLEAGRPLTGADLGRQFGRTDRWGRMQIRKFRAELDAGNTNGNRPAGNGASAGRNGDQVEHAPVDRNGRRPADVGHNRVVPLVAGTGAPVRKPDGSGHRPGAEPAAADLTDSGDSAGSQTDRPAQAETPPRPEDGPAEASRKWPDSLITLVVALVCAAASFGHMYHVALLAGEPVWIARAWPVTVDGLVLAALRRGQEGRLWLALGIVVSMAANVLAQFPELAEAAGPFVSAWPPVALYGTHRLLHGARRRSTGTTAD